MSKRALLAVAGFFGLCLSLPAQSPEQLLFNGDTLYRPSVSLANQDRFLFSTTFGSIHATPDFLPTFSPGGPRSVVSPPMLDSKDYDNVVEMRAPSRVYYGGEIGFLYGKSTGKYGREDFRPESCLLRRRNRFALRKVHRQIRP